MKKNLKIIMIVSLFSTYANAQVGLLSNNPNKDAVLDLNKTDGTNTKGLLLPKVALTAINSASPMTAHVKGMRVYNTATAGSGATRVIPGMYFNDGTQWVDISADWEVTGTGATDVTVNFIGNMNAVDFPVRTNNSERMRVTNTGKVLVGSTTVPTGGTNSKMIINNGTTKGAIQIKDGSEGLKKAFVSDANGVGTWKDQSVDVIFINPEVSSGVDIPFNTGPNWLYTKSKITLPVGKWLVTVNMLLTKYKTGVPTWWTASNESWWVRTTFSDSSTAMAISPDIISRSTLISGLLPANSYYALMTGTLIINNTSGANKTYYYIGGQMDVLNPTGSLASFGGTWAENSFMLQRIN
ncbi:hypothetical protein [Flavobacterium notoginsengisoli]|uniref:hypothetical protein n=1 Tax=Flavobacterium notoginsengisoli TaxID=1478199 RepID=UPI003632DB9A